MNKKLRTIEPGPVPAAFRPVVYKLLAIHLPDYDHIVSLLYEQYNIVTTRDEVYSIYKKNRVQVYRVRDKLENKIEEIEVDPAEILKATNRLLNLRVKRALDDSEKLEALDMALSEGTIDGKEYRRRASGLSKMSTAELIKLADHLTPKKVSEPPQPAQPALPTGNSSPANDALQASLNAAIARGDTVEVQRILWGGGDKNLPAETSASREPDETANKNRT